MLFRHPISHPLWSEWRLFHSHPTLSVKILQFFGYSDIAGQICRVGSQYRFRTIADAAGHLHERDPESQQLARVGVPRAVEFPVVA